MENKNASMAVIHVKHQQCTVHKYLMYVYIIKAPGGAFALCTLTPKHSRILTINENDLFLLVALHPDVHSAV